MSNQVTQMDMLEMAGECTAGLYVSGMGEMILRAEYLI